MDLHDKRIADVIHTTCTTCIFLRGIFLGIIITTILFYSVLHFPQSDLVQYQRAMEACKKDVGSDEHCEIKGIALKNIKKEE